MLIFLLGGTKSLSQALIMNTERNNIVHTFNRGLIKTFLRIFFISANTFTRHLKFSTQLKVVNEILDLCILAP